MGKWGPSAQDPQTPTKSKVLCVGHLPVKGLRLGWNLKGPTEKFKYPTSNWVPLLGSWLLFSLEQERVTAQKEQPKTGASRRKPSCPNPTYGLSCQLIWQCRHTHTYVHGDTPHTPTTPHTPATRSRFVHRHASPHTPKICHTHSVCLTSALQHIHAHGALTPLSTRIPGRMCTWCTPC